jgi:Holliday junction resolvase RusA-like endonuclease
MKINIKPLSLNQAYRGRRFSTRELADYKLYIWANLPPRSDLIGKLAVSYIFGVSNSNTDADNLIKCFQDALAEAYGFNDNQIYEWQIKKVIVPKGKEFVDFQIEPSSHLH